MVGVLAPNSGHPPVTPPPPPHDLVRQSLGVVQAKDDSVVEPRRLVADTPLLSLGTTQRLLV